MTTILDIQKRLIALGYNVGRTGADGWAGPATKSAIEKFQRDNGLVVDGNAGPKTLAKLMPAPALQDFPIPANWLPDTKIKGIVLHWTGGAHKASGLDRSHYHLLIEDDGKLIRGIPSIELNTLPTKKKGYAAHTLNCNTGYIGVSLCCMAGAIEYPFDSGTAPMTRTQWNALPPVLSQLCQRYSIKVSPETVLSHAEVQDNLKIKQRGKWDISRLSFNPSLSGARAIGDKIRASITL